MADKKVFILGVDGMDPKLTRQFVDEGLMPNVAQLIARGSARYDLGMLGGHPTVTPPMWTTLATGAYPCTHGISGFQRIVPGKPTIQGYNLDSRNCEAEPLWNVTVEAGIKTLVFHWPGSSWPPTSKSELLHVIDGTQPAAVNMGVAQIESELVLVASEQTDDTIFREKCATDCNVPCVVTDLKVSDDYFNLADVAGGDEGFELIVLSPDEGQGSMTDAPFDVVLSTVKPAAGWLDRHEDAKEFTALFSKGFIRRPAQILKNDQGIYDRIALYKSKKDEEPFAIVHNNEFCSGVIDVALKDDVYKEVTRNMKVLEIREDGSYVKLWVSAAMMTQNDEVWHPKRLYQSVVSACGYPSPESMLGAADVRLIEECMIENWKVMGQWQSKAIHHLLATEDYGAIFSHFHIVDGCGHMIVKFLKERANSKLTEEQYMHAWRMVYEETDRYIGTFMHMLDEGWTIMVVSDHAQVSPEHEPPMLADSGISVRVMQELGLTALKKDENGNELHEIDWEHTLAIDNGNHILVNLKGRYEHGIVEPEDQYEVEEEIMTRLYGYKDKKTGKRVVSLALRNKDALILGMGGETCGDIIFFLAEGYTYDHADAISTTEGYANTSEGPIFIAAGPGIKEGYTTTRYIREADVTPTMAQLLGVRMPEQCEGAVIYQILA